ncbi:MAG: DoxX family protein [Rhodothermales bacterium]|jgi:putative oxidoreductase
MKPYHHFLIGGDGGASVVADAGLLVLRLMAGLALAFAHGTGKIPPSAGFIEGVEALGFPAPAFFGWAAGIAELVGGVCLAVGLLTRPASVLIAFTMAVAFFLRHADDPFATKEKAFLFGGIALLFIFVGAGRFSLDSFLRGRASKHTVSRYAR